MPKQPPEVGTEMWPLPQSPIITCTVDLSMFGAFKSCWLYGYTVSYTCNKVEHDRICSRIDGVGIR